MGYEQIRLKSIDILLLRQYYQNVNKIKAEQISLNFWEAKFYEKIFSCCRYAEGLC